MGDRLREAAIMGDVEKVKSIMKDKGNPSSTDKYGLSPLMYAVWNGHGECVKVLLANGFHGVSSEGVKGPSFNLVTVKGYTALHLVALDSPPGSAEEICFNLLLFNVDRGVRCKEGLTAKEISMIKENTEVLRAFEQYESMEKIDLLPVKNKKTRKASATARRASAYTSIRKTSTTARKDSTTATTSASALTTTTATNTNAGANTNTASTKKTATVAFNIIEELEGEEEGESEAENVDIDTKTELQKRFDLIMTKYGHTRVPNRILNIPDIENEISIRANSEQTNRKNKFMMSTAMTNKNHYTAPSHLANDKTCVSLPEGMSLYEHNLAPMALEGVDLKGVKALNALGYVEEQAAYNLERRRNLLVATERSIDKYSSVSAVRVIGNNMSGIDQNTLNSGIKFDSNIQDPSDTVSTVVKFDREREREMEKERDNIRNANSLARRPLSSREKERVRERKEKEKEESKSTDKLVTKSLNKSPDKLGKGNLKRVEKGVEKGKVREQSDRAQSEEETEKTEKFRKETKSEEKAEQIIEAVDIFEFEQHLVPDLPISQLRVSHPLPWEDDAIISADTRYVMRKKNIYIA